MIHYDHCPACSSHKISKVISAKDHTVSQEVFEIWQCSHCSLRFTQNVPDESESGRYYKSDNYISHTDSAKGFINMLYLQVRKYTLQAKKKFIEKITGRTNGTVLDIGAGTGAFLNTMHKAGWKVEGVEPDTDAISRAQRLYGLSLKPSKAIFDFPEKTFDVITMWHVLEHVHDLHGCLNRMKILCKPEGRIVIAVPNYTSSDANHYGAAWAAYDVPRHLYHFSPASMTTLMQKHHCVIESIHPMWFDSYYVSLLSEKYVDGSSNLLKGFLNGFRSNSRAFTNRRLASSLIYVVKLKT